MSSLKPNANASAEHSLDPREVEAGKAEVGESKKSGYGAVHELTADFLKHMLDQSQSGMGKFIRIGDLILVGPGSLQGGIHHKDFLSRVSVTNDELKAKIANAQTVALLGGKPLLRQNQVGMQDAGALLTTRKDDGEIEAVKIMGQSGDFGMADEQGRQETVWIAQQALGDNISVGQ